VEHRCGLEQPPLDVGGRPAGDEQGDGGRRRAGEVVEDVGEPDRLAARHLPAAAREMVALVE